MNFPLHVNAGRVRRASVYKIFTRPRRQCAAIAKRMGVWYSTI